MELHARAEAAQRAARQAGEMVRHHGQLQVRSKSDNDFVTQMDLKSETLIREALIGQFPEDEFYGEESGGARTSRGRWIVDPIDGTQSYLRGHHGYGISIAYEHDGQLLIGVVYMPDNDEMFLGIRGEGAFLNGKPIHVSEFSDPHHALVHFGYGHRVLTHRKRTMAILPELFEHISDVRRYGSAAYAICCVACGRSDIFFEMGLFIYDFAAAAVILEEAGGRITGWTADEDFCTIGNIIATNGHLHDFMLDIVRE